MDGPEANKGFILSYILGSVHHLEKSGQDLKTGPGGRNYIETMEQCCFPACFTCFLIAPRTTRLSCDTTHGDLGTHILIINQGNTSGTGLPMGQSCGGLLLSEIPFSQMTLAVPS